MNTVATHPCEGCGYKTVAAGPCSTCRADAMVVAYLTAALFSETGPDSEPLDQVYGIEQFSPEAWVLAVADCKEFCRQAAPWIRQMPAGCKLSDLGHDLWLTRNHHGAGFWDGDWPEPVGTALTDLTKKFKELSIYLDKGSLHFE